MAIGASTSTRAVRGPRGRAPARREKFMAGLRAGAEPASGQFQGDADAGIPFGDVLDILVAEGTGDDRHLRMRPRAVPVGLELDDEVVPVLAAEVRRAGKRRLAVETVAGLAQHFRPRATAL